MKNVTNYFLPLCLSLIPALGLALPPGPILGLQLGETNTHISPSKSGLNQADIRNFSFNGRFYYGSQVTANFGYEIGYLRIRKVRVLNMNDSGENGQIMQHGLDFLARVNWRFAPDLDLIGRFGASYLIAKPDTSLREYSSNDFSKHRVAHYRPALGIGISYKAAFPVSLEANWLHLQAHRALAKLDFISVGATLYTNGV